ncbi:MAG: zinc-binding dehydrogenase [Blautia sp.]|nr:zinc-binding dehydrogenase [Blautia sp.]MDY5030649.1 zinc-binding dehydrogenase [Blautia sp.]
MRVLNGLDLESRLLTERVLVIAKIVKRAVQLYKMNEYTKVVVAGGKTEGLLTAAVLKCLGIHEIFMITGNDTSLELAKLFGAKEVIHYHQKGAIPQIQEKIRKCFGGKLGDVVFQFKPGNSINRLIEKNGCVCAMASVMSDRQDARYYDETRPVVRRYYSVKEYEECFEILDKAAQLKLPLYRLITHRYSLEEVNEAHWNAVCDQGLVVAVFNR